MCPFGLQWLRDSFNEEEVNIQRAFYLVGGWLPIFILMVIENLESR